MMVLSTKRLRKEIKSIKEAIVNMEKTKIKCEDGIDLNQFVLKSFENLLLERE